MTDLKKFIAEQQAKQQAERPVDWDKRKDRWLSELAQLFSTIRTMLIDAGLAEAALTSTTHAIREEMLGSYQAPGLRVQMPTGAVDFTPVASVIIGGYGRVDVTETSGSDKVKLIAQDPDSTTRDESIPSYERPWAWKVYPAVGAKGGYVFDDEGLARLLKTVMGE